MAGQHGYMTAGVWTGTRAALDALVAELAASRILNREPSTMLRIRPSGIDVLEAASARTELLFTAGGRPQDAVKTVVERLRTTRTRECALELARGLAIVTKMTLPAEGNDIVRAIVRNKVEGIAPWPLNQSVFGHRVAALAGDPAHVAVDVAVVSRALLEDVTAQLAEAGTSVKALQVRLADEDVLRLDFAAHDNLKDAHRRAGLLASGLTLIAMLVAFYGLFLAWTSADELSRDRQRTTALLESLRETSGPQGDSTLLAAANGLHLRRMGRQPAVAVLNDLSSLIPQDVWLESLSLEGDRLELKGQGTDIPSLISILERSDSFSNVNFTSATQLNAELNAEAFSIGATLERVPSAEASYK